MCIRDRSLLAFMKAQETHLSVNSRLDAFMRNAEMVAHVQGMAEGRAQGRTDANARTDELARGLRLAPGDRPPRERVSGPAATARPRPGLLAIRAGGRDRRRDASPE